MVRTTDRFRVGLTQIELIIGLVITILTLGALSAFLASTAAAWRAAEQVQGAQTVSIQATNRIQETLRRAKYVGFGGLKADNTGSALLFWRDDTNLDGRMQLGEIALLDHVSATATVTLYTVPANHAAAANLANITDIDESADVGTFKALAGITGQVVVREVTELALKCCGTGDAKQRPSVQFKLRTVRDGKGYGELQTAALRSPRSKPVSCDGLATCTCTTSGGSCCMNASACGCAGDMACRSSATTNCRTTVQTSFEKNLSTTSASTATTSGQ